jgi:hypothetical protein
MTNRRTQTTEQMERAAAKKDRRKADEKRAAEVKRQRQLRERGHK